MKNLCLFLSVVETQFELCVPQGRSWPRVLDLFIFPDFRIIPSELGN